MAIEFSDGFDYYPAANLLRKWTSGSATATAGVYAGNAARFNGSSNTTVTKSLPSSTATKGVSFYFRVSSFNPGAPVILFREGATVHVAMYVDTTGEIFVARNVTKIGANSVNSLSVATWYHIEIKTFVHDTTGTVEVRVNGTSTGWINLTGQDTQNGGTGVIDTIAFTGPSSVTSDFDHFVVWTTTGNAPIDFMGDSKIVPIYVTGDSAVDNAWTASTGSAKYAMVDETSTNDDTDYIYSSAAGNIQGFTKPACGVTTIRAVAINVMNRKDDASNYLIAPTCRSGGTTYVNATTAAPAATYTQTQWIYDQDPATAAAWTESGLNNAEFGVKQVT